jgi:ribonuclease HI
MTTNNRMELMGGDLRRCRADGPARSRSTPTASICARASRAWIHGWKKNGWKTADASRSRTRSSGSALDAALKQHKIEWKWVKGHAGDPDERARRRAGARKGMAPFKKG